MVRNGVLFRVASIIAGYHMWDHLMTLTPAYGRDYKTAKAAKADWNDNKDFVVSDFFSPWDGQYINKELGFQTEDRNIILRFDKLRKTTPV